VKRLSLKAAGAIFVAFVCAVSGWTVRSSREVDDGGRKPIVFRAGWLVGGDIDAALHRLEPLHPHYRVTTTTATTQDASVDAQRLLPATAGGVPPDVVFFDRFAVGEWVSTGMMG
jgi:hypothetical protein